jgi:hypothetical protein
MKRTPQACLCIFTSITCLGGLPKVTSAAEIQCPSQISVHEQTDPLSLGGWQVFNANPRGIHHFYGVAFSQGPPADLVYFNPRKIATQGNVKTEFYDFGTQIAGELWISCLFRDTSQIVAKPIEPKPTKCQVAFDPKRVEVVKTVHCD